jgi:NADH-quinone oxidoreductase subunit L
MCRISPLLALSHPAQLVVATVGVATAFVAALIACGQQDIKKVLAYSTVSQLGYMFLAVGIGAYEAAIFLMVAHAFFKGLLFLGAGSVIHGLHDEQDLKRMGNLRRYMKLTFVTFGVGWLAIAGIPPLSGFWAKGDILENAFARYPVLWAIGLVTAALTAYYMSRLMALAFYGDDRWRQIVDARSLPTYEAGPAPSHGQLAGDAAPHEAPWVMTLPLVVLAVLALVGGALNLPWHSGWDPLRWLSPVFGSHLYTPSLGTAARWALPIGDAAVALLGLVVALPVWIRRADIPALEPSALRRALYVDDIYDAAIGRPSEAMAQFTAVVVEKRVIDGAVNGIGRLVQITGQSLRRVQTGFVRQYALWLVFGMVALLAWMISRAWL